MSLKSLWAVAIIMSLMTMMVCPVVDVCRASKPSPECHTEKPQDSGDTSQTMRQCCDQKALTVSSPDPYNETLLSHVSADPVAESRCTEDHEIRLHHPAIKTSERLALLNILRA